MNAARRILVPCCSADEAAFLLPVAAAIAQGWDGRVLLFGVVCVEREKSLSEGAVPAQELRRDMEALAAQYPLVDALPSTKVAYVPWEEIQIAAVESQADLMLLPWSEDGLAYGEDLRQILSDPPCDVAVVRPGEPIPAHRILLPLRGGPHAELSLRVVVALAEAWGSEVTVVHVLPPAPSAASDRPFRNLLPVIEDLSVVTRIVTLHEPAPGGIQAEMAHHDLVVLGATAQPKMERFALGRMTSELYRIAPGTAIAVKSRQPMPLAESTPLQPAQPPTGYDAISIVVDKWFGENTFHSHEFEDLYHLVELKKAQGFTISLGLPALNEEATVGRVISVCKSALMDEVPLLDEIVLIDSQSSDRTREIAASLGVPVYIHPEILPQHGHVRGKGEALWKSLYVLQGDIIAWIDTDITNIHPRFVYGLLGPLLREPRIQYVKGFYRRPLRVGEKLQAGAGGRVTELVARPMLNLFYPELSGLVQPLAGEYAGRRQALEQTPFFTGYGVETGLLIDMLDKFGLSAIAQVDLEERIHKNQELTALSKMSFQILQVFVHRLEQRHGPMLAEINKTMKLVCQEDGRFCLDVEDIREHERPPMLEVSAYRERHAALPKEAT